MRCKMQNIVFFAPLFFFDLSLSVVFVFFLDQFVDWYIDICWKENFIFQSLYI